MESIAHSSRGNRKNLCRQLFGPRALTNNSVEARARRERNKSTRTPTLSIGSFYWRTLGTICRESHPKIEHQFRLHKMRVNSASWPVNRAWPIPLICRPTPGGYLSEAMNTTLLCKAWPSVCAEIKPAYSLGIHSALEPLFIRACCNGHQMESLEHPLAGRWKL